MSVGNVLRQKMNETKKEIKNMKLPWNTLNVVVIRRKTYEKKNGVEAIVVMNGVLWLKEKHIKEGLDNKNL